MKNINKIFISLSLVMVFFAIMSFGTLETNVYICTGKYSKKYHYSKTCRGLSNCKGTIKKVTLKDAKSIKRTLCGWED